MRNLLRRLDHFLDRNWRKFAEFLNRLVMEDPLEDIDWLNMHNDMVNSKKDKQ